MVIRMAKAVVVGAGIGGLAAALALRSKGWGVEVYERAARLEKIGAGLAIAPNALRSLDVLGLGDRVRELAAFGEASAGVCRHDGTWLVKTDQEAAKARWGDVAVVLPRAGLLDTLADGLEPGTLRLGTEVTSVDSDRGTVSTAAGETEADLIVAADGVRSPIRTGLFPDHPGPVYAGETAWRLLLNDVPMRVGGIEYWGRAGVIATMPLAGDALYMYAAALAPAGERSDDERKVLLDKFGDWAHPLPELLASVEPESVLRNDVYHIATRLPAFHKGKVAILGDAAHAMTPHLGQGACQAIEDAVVLAHEVTHGDGLAGYTRARLPRTMKIVKDSHSTMKLALMRNRLAIAARDTAIRAMTRIAPRAGLNRFDPVFSWKPPASD